MVLLPALLILLAGSHLNEQQQTPRELLQQGIEAFKAAQYDEAVETLKEAVAADPKLVEAFRYLGLAYLAPGTPEGFDPARAAFRRILELDPRNVEALRLLANLALQQAAASPGQAAFTDEASGYLTRLLGIDSNNTAAHYSLAVITWDRFYPAWKAARTRAGLGVGDPGPLKDATLRRALKEQWAAPVQAAIEHLEKVLAVDPNHEEAMSRLSLFLRERADWSDNTYSYLAEIAKADAWMKKAIALRKSKPQ